ncbi:MAG: hypothetical protein KIT43_02730 [Bauldia sp.]|nr:hypothetical protein [Bauldia sp.]MCW5719238.1 hypothetical protein [Bauldia sp.]
MKKSSKLLQALAAAGVAASVTMGGVGSASAAKPDSTFASRFKEPGDTGRPDIFGPPGKPVIGPPGQYEG